LRTWTRTWTRMQRCGRPGKRKEKNFKFPL
jgi:hypothetical protein